MASLNGVEIENAQPIGRYRIGSAAGCLPSAATIQHAGPKLPTYNTGNAMKIPAAVHFAHRSRLLTIRTASQIQKATSATPRTESTMVIPGFYPRWRRGGKRNVT